MAPGGSSNIRVFVHWHDQNVFAGEDVRCSITFRNVARPPGSPAGSSSAQSGTNSPALAGADRARQRPSTHGRPKAGNGGLAPPNSSATARGHRASLSLSVPPSSGGRARSGSTPWSPTSTASDASNARNGHAHRRSLSIVSLGSTSPADSPSQFLAQSAQAKAAQRPPRGHARSASLQIVSRAPLVNGPRSVSHPYKASNLHTAPLRNASFPADQFVLPSRPSGSSTVPNTPAIADSAAPGPGPDVLSGFRFPSRLDVNGTGNSVDGTISSPTSTLGDGPGGLLRQQETVPMINEKEVASAARVLSSTSMAGTPRSSGEFYSLSNNSTETLASEYVTQLPATRAQGRPPHSRRTSNLSAQGQAGAPETLMMGYAQIQGSFTLDGSLVNLGPFDQVKRKAVVGGHGGGGVVGIETSKRDSGLLRAFGWRNLTSSLGDLLGGGELSTIKEMRGMASAKSIPLLSTPQSILFVDLQLAPGESKTFSYSFRLPRGLPPTHRGRAMKITYGLVIGTQRPGSASEQQVRSVDVPFRVLGSVNSHGEILGHDLMSPYILLRDQAKVHAMDRRKPKAGRDASPSSSADGFFSYVDELLSRPRQGSGSGSAGALFSPTAPTPSRRTSSYFEEAATAREAINLAILRSNAPSPDVHGQQFRQQPQRQYPSTAAAAANRFEIARNGRRVGVVLLTRPAYRLGEAVTVVVDFSASEIPCYALHASLETSERVDPALALRSEASVHRVTRKVYVSASEAALHARRLVFAPTIPVTATPEFVTSGVSLEWKIRLEFVVPALLDDEDDDRSSAPRSSSQQQHRRRRQEGEDDEDDDEDDEEEEEDDEPRRRPQQNGDNSDSPDDDDDDDEDEEGGGHSSRLLRATAPGKKRALLFPPLLEEISRDDKGGLVLVAVENLACESFEVAVPLRVYGAVCEGLERLDRDVAADEGLVV